MNSIAEFFKKKIKFSRTSKLRLPGESPPVNVTQILHNPEKILIIPYNHMGTVLLSTRVFKSIRDHYKSSKIAVIVNNSWSILIQNDPTIDEVVTFGGEAGNPHSKAFQNMGKSLAEQGFNIAFFLSYQFDAEMAYLTRLSCADLRISFKSEHDIPFFNVEIVPSPGIQYEVNRYLEMLRTLGIAGSIRDYCMTISDTIRDKVRRRYLPGVQKHGLVGFDLTKEIVGNAISRKSAESILNTLIHNIQATVIVFFEPEKKSIAAALKETFGKSIILVEDRPVSQIAGLMSFCSFILTGNTDLFQLAISLKTPTIAMLTANEMRQWSPGECEHISHLERSGSSWPSSSTIIQTSRHILQKRNHV